jgi:hypothetical protein
MTGIVVVLVVFLVITWIQGDDTNNLEERQPEPSPAQSSAPALNVPGTTTPAPVLSRGA